MVLKILLLVDYTLLDVIKDEDSNEIRPRKKTKRLTSNIQFVAGGFVYHNNVIHGNPPLRYLTCAELKKSGCRGRATLPLGGSIDFLKMTQPHNHPPDINAGDRLGFLLDLKNTVRAMESATLKHVYEVVSYKYERPNIPLKRHGTIDFGDGYLYRKLKKVHHKMYLKCAMVKELNCKASYVLEGVRDDSLQETYRCLVPHNHPPNELVLQSARFMKDLEEAIQIFPGSTKEIFDQVIEGYPEVKNVYTYSNVVGRMHHWLKKYSVRKRYAKASN